MKINNLKNNFYGTGRRKTAIARVFLSKGNGTIIINKKKIDVYFPNNILYKLYTPINLFGLKNKLNLNITVKGGGFTGQIEAIRHGIARALIKYDSSLKNELKKNNLLTRDSRKVERKKVGLKKSRKAPQYSKR